MVYYCSLTASRLLAHTINLNDPIDFKLDGSFTAASTPAGGQSD